jgi:hypothetical protein
MDGQLINPFPALTAGARSLAHVASYAARPACGPGAHSALAATGLSALIAHRPAKHSSLAARASTLAPPNKVFDHVRWNSTAERGIPLLLKRAENEERIASNALEVNFYTWLP